MRDSTHQTPKKQGFLYFSTGVFLSHSSYHTTCHMGCRKDKWGRICSSAPGYVPTQLIIEPNVSIFITTSILIIKPNVSVFIISTYMWSRSCPPWSKRDLAWAKQGGFTREIKVPRAEFLGVMRVNSELPKSISKDYKGGTSLFYIGKSLTDFRP